MNTGKFYYKKDCWPTCEIDGCVKEWDVGTRLMLELKPTKLPDYKNSELLVPAVVHSWDIECDHQGVEWVWFIFNHPDNYLPEGVSQITSDMICSIDCETCCDALSRRIDGHEACFTIPATAFDDPDNPTEAEVEAWASAQSPPVPKGAWLIYGSWKWELRECGWVELNDGDSLTDNGDGTYKGTGDIDDVDTRYALPTFKAECVATGGPGTLYNRKRFTAGDRRNITQVTWYAWPPGTSIDAAVQLNDTNRRTLGTGFLLETADNDPLVTDGGIVVMVARDTRGQDRISEPQCLDPCIPPQEFGSGTASGNVFRCIRVLASENNGVARLDTAIGIGGNGSTALSYVITNNDHIPRWFEAVLVFGINRIEQDGPENIESNLNYLMNSNEAQLSARLGIVGEIPNGNQGLDVLEDFYASQLPIPVRVGDSPAIEDIYSPPLISGFHRYNSNARGSTQRSRVSMKFRVEAGETVTVQSALWVKYDDTAISLEKYERIHTGQIMRIYPIQLQNIPS